MKQAINRVAHYQGGTSDKVYMACVRCATDCYEVLGKWGRRGKKLSSQVKGKHRTLPDALAARDLLFSEKEGEGYQDIDSASYCGPVTMRDPEIAANLEKLGMAKVGKSERIPLESDRMLDPEKQVAICVDRSGLEDKFDEGIEYVFEKCRTPGMVFVYDKLGEKAEYFVQRFRFVKGE